MGKLQKAHEWYSNKVDAGFNAIGNLKDSTISNIRGGLTTIRGSGSVINEIHKLKKSAGDIGKSFLGGEFKGEKFEGGVLKATKDFLSLHPIEAVKSTGIGLLGAIKNTGKVVVSPIPTGIAAVSAPASKIAKGVKAVGTTIAKPGKYAIQGIGAIASGVKKYFTDTTPPATASSDISAGPAKSAPPPLPDKPKADASMPEDKPEPKEKPAEVRGTPDSSGDKPAEDKLAA